MPPPCRGTTSYDMTGSNERVRWPCPIVVPNGPAAARSGSTWIHCRSPVASANASMRSWPTSIQDEGPYSLPISSIAPPYDTRSPRVPRPRREEQDELAVAQVARARGAVEREQRVHAAHVTGVVEVRGARLVHPELGDER